MISTNLWEEIDRFGPSASCIFLDNDSFLNSDMSLAISNLKEEGMTDEHVKYLLSSGFTGEHYRRTGFREKYSFAVPSKEAIGMIREFVEGDSVLEVGAGYGLWAKLMQDDSIDIVATNRIIDLKEDKNYIPKGRENNFINVEELNNLEAIHEYEGFNVLMLIWPPYADSMAYDSLNSFKGDKLIYIGEGYGGCTGCDEFHKLLDNEWEEDDSYNIPQWSGLHDHMILYCRKA